MLLSMSHSVTLLVTLTTDHMTNGVSSVPGDASRVLPHAPQPLVVATQNTPYAVLHFYFLI